MAARQGRWRSRTVKRSGDRGPGLPPRRAARRGAPGSSRRSGRGPGGCRPGSCACPRRGCRPERPPVRPRPCGALRRSRQRSPVLWRARGWCNPLRRSAVGVLPFRSSGSDPALRTPLIVETTRTIRSLRVPTGISAGGRVTPKGPLAQLVAHLHDAQGVTGSSPVRPTRRIPGQRAWWGIAFGRRARGASPTREHPAARMPIQQPSSPASEVSGRTLRCAIWTPRVSSAV